MLTRYRRELSVLVAYLLLLLVLFRYAPDFFAAQQILVLMVSISPMLIVAVGMTIIIISRQIDISVGSQFSLCGVIAGVLAQNGCPMPIVAVLTILLGIGLGAVNGFFVAGLGLPPIVITLAIMAIIRQGLNWWREGEFVLGLPENFQWLGSGQQLGQWLVVGSAIVVFLIFTWGMSRLRMGRAVYATGSAPEAARLVGIRPRLVVFNTFALMGGLVGLASLMHAIQFPSVDPRMGFGIELQAIAAVVVGGTAVSGGRGTLWGTLIGVMLLGSISPALVHLHIPAAWEKAIQGLIILLAVASDAFRKESH